MHCTFGSFTTGILAFDELIRRLSLLSGGCLGAQSGYLGSWSFPRSCKVRLQSERWVWPKLRPSRISDGYFPMLASERQGRTIISKCSCTCAWLTCIRMSSSSLSACKPFRKLILALNCTPEADSGYNEIEGPWSKRRRTSQLPLQAKLPRAEKWPLQRSRAWRRSRKGKNSDLGTTGQH